MAKRPTPGQPAISTGAAKLYVFSMLDESDVYLKVCPRACMSMRFSYLLLLNTYQTTAVASAACQTQWLRHNHVKQIIHAKIEQVKGLYLRS